MKDVDVEALEDMEEEQVAALSQKSAVDNVFKKLDLNKFATNSSRGHSAMKHNMGKSVQKRHANIAAGRQLVQNGA